MPIYEIDFRNGAQVMQALRNYGAAVEDELEKSLRDVISPRVVDRVMLYMPRSDRNKRHAKDSKSFKSTMLTKLSAEFRTTSNYGYLIFPEEGRGPYNPREQRFVKRAVVDDSRPMVMEEVTNALERAAKKFKGD